MVNFTDKGPKPTNGRFLGFDHLTFFVGNAKQAASYYITRLGFEPVAYKGLETGSRQYAGHVVRLKEITLLFLSAYEPTETELGTFLAKHGDEVKDVAFTVENLENIVKTAEARGAKVLKNIWEESDSDGTVRFATIKTFGENTHTFIDRSKYKGLFLPGYTPCSPDALSMKLPPSNFDYIDHVVGNQPDKGMEPIAQWYENVLQFHRFWSVDDKDVQTKYSSLRSTIMSNWEENIKITIAEPALGLRKSQIEEFIEYHGGPGVQHIAFHTENLVESVRNLKERGMEFLHVPDSYYEMLKKNLKTCVVDIQEELSVLQELKILIDYDENGYLLQIFTKNMQDRPTLFIELIQRRNHNGFGAANFRALFEAIEAEQEKRGNLY